MHFPFPTANNNGYAVYALFAGVKRKPPGSAMLETVGNSTGQQTLKVCNESLNGIMPSKLIVKVS